MQTGIWDGKKKQGLFGAMGWEEREFAPNRLFILADERHQK